MSLMMDNKAWPERDRLATSVACRGSSEVEDRRLAMPITPLSGVLIS